ncbi:hypothetical protein GCM10010302_01960 [Streptomyces polychromogenes]|uniref:Uncharacterized protein n=1 Tax=Streptomyces polychromogenes TaxID=67342 RepID=A0ABN0UZF8_9ACTN
MGQHADDHLDGHEAADQGERDRQPAAVGVRVHPVAVPGVPVAVPVGVALCGTVLVLVLVSMVVSEAAAVASGHGFPRLFGSDA